MNKEVFAKGELLMFVHLIYEFLDYSLQDIAAHLTRRKISIECIPIGGKA